MIRISPTIFLDESELEYHFIRSPGPGGQNVNKLATGVQLRFNILNSPSLPEELRLRFAKLHGSKLTQGGEIIIKASRYRAQEKNKQDALERLRSWLLEASIRPKKRKKTKPSFSSVQRRLNQKKRQGKIKQLRRTKPGREN